jgi:glutathione-regulated potassium-efflux system protein KefB
VHLLQDLGVKHIWRETYLSALELSQALLTQLNPDPEESLQQIQNFREQDEKLLNSQYHLDPDEHPNYENQRSSLAELEHLFTQDQRHKAQKQDTPQQQDTNGAGIDTLRDELS